MDDLQMDSVGIRLRKKALAQDEWYLYLGKYHVAKKAIDHLVERAKNPFIGAYSIHSWQMPIACKEKIQDTNDMKKLFLAIKEHVSKLVGEACNVEFISIELKNGEVRYGVLVRRKIDRSKLPPYLLEEADDE